MLERIPYMIARIKKHCGVPPLMRPVCQLRAGLLNDWIPGDGFRHGDMAESQVAAEPPGRH
jgi:hypothetical protein